MLKQLTKMKIFCSEQLKITCNLTTFTMIPQNKNCGQQRQHIFLTHDVEIEII